MTKYLIVISVVLSLFSCVYEPEKVEVVSVVEDIESLDSPEISVIVEDTIPAGIKIGAKVIGQASVYLSKDGDSSEQTISYTYYSSPEADFMDSINQRIYVFTQGITEFEGQDEKEKVSIDYFENQLDSLVTIFNSSKEDEFTLWSLDASIDVKDSFPSFVELHMGSYAYTGGAHGNGYYSITMIDKENGAVLKLEDFISNIDELNKIAEPLFFKVRGIEDGDLSEFWFGDPGFTVNNNFYFDNGNLIFEYNSYEIAPYAAGPTTLEIPISEIEHLLIRKAD